VQTKITKTSLWATTTTLVFCEKILCLCVREFLSNESVKRGVPLEKTIFCCYWLV